MRIFTNIAVAAIILSCSTALAVASPKGTIAGKYAAIVIDANSGKTLYQYNANARRYPASLTKMMTLYLLFEAMQSGRVPAGTPIRVSAYAAARPPTKIGFKPGQTITAENAAKALITKSANDVASAVGEYLGGSEKGFARMMTLKARRLGMKNTNFTNASGLPDTQNYSTARDMAILSVALREHFPQYYSLFSTTSFQLRGKVIHGHNRLVQTMKGVDGIKTGYTNMSGFNLASSVRANGKSLVGVVMGGQKASTRDAHMAALLGKYFKKASRRKAAHELVARSEPFTPPVPEKRGSLPGGNMVDVPVPVAKTKVVLASVSDREHDSALLTALASTGSRLPAAVIAVDEIVLKKPAAVPVPVFKAGLSGKASGRFDGVTTASVDSEKTGWVIQIASAPSQREADQMLNKATRTARSVLASAEPYTQIFDKGDERYYRARFSGFSSRQEARRACLALEKAEFECYTAKN